MPSVQQMRAELEKKYNKAFVARIKSDNQVIAIYQRLKLNNKI